MFIYYMQLQKLYNAGGSDLPDWLLASAGGTSLPPLSSVDGFIATANSSFTLADLLIYGICACALIAVIVQKTRK